MRFLHIIPYFLRATKTGGPAVQLGRLAISLISLGHTVRIVTSTGNLNEEIDLIFHDDHFDTDEGGVRTTYFRRKKDIFPSTYYYAPKLRDWLLKHLDEYDIVIIHGIWTYFSWMGARICQNKKIPYLFFVHGSLDPWAIKHHWFKKKPYWHLVEKTNLRKSSGIIALSEDEAAQVGNLKIKKPIYIAKNGLLFPVQHENDPNKILKNLIPGLEDRPFVLFISRIHPKKGIDILLQAWEKIIIEHPDWRLVLAGPDESGYIKQIIHKIHQYNISQSIFLPGLVEREFKAALLQKARIFVLSSYSEGVPGSVIEAMAYGQPVVITTGCHLPEVVEYQAGIIVEPEYISVANALLKLIGDPILCQQMGKNAEQLAYQTFDEQKVAVGFVNFCQKILEGNTRSETDVNIKY